MTDWREPYRSMDAAGGPDTASQVGWGWLVAIARAEHDRDPAGLELDHPTDGAVRCVLYRGTKPIAAFFVTRDPMNFAQLFRWLAPDPAVATILREARDEIEGAMSVYADHPDGMGSAYREASKIRRRLDAVIDGTPNPGAVD